MLHTMDSAHSGSLQSSSGGDDDLDSTRLPRSASSSRDPLLSFFQLPSSSNTDHSIYNSQLSLPDFANHPPQQPQQQHHLIDQLPAFIDQSPAATSHLPTTATASASATATASTPRSGGSSSSRKRTRASRRAPTTVLTTDTSNFRAMVQEFTGIPSPPFAPSPAAAALTRSSFDHRLFSSSPSLQQQQPPYLLRPFAHKLSMPPVSNSPSAQTAIAPATADLARTQSLLTVPPNSFLTFQSLLQSQLQAAAPSMAVSNDYLWHASGSGSASASAPGPNMPESIDQLNASVSAGYAAAASTQQQRRASTGCKLNYSSTGSSELIVDVSRQEETAAVAATRGEGMVDSWLCSSSSSSRSDR